MVPCMTFLPPPLFRPVLAASAHVASSACTTGFFPARAAEVFCLAADSCEPGLPEGKPSLVGEKIGITIIAVLVGYTLGAAGVTPRSLWLAPGAIAANPIFQKAASKTFRGGLSGALAGVVQVLTLMWLRTTMNYQYRNGGSTSAAAKALWKEGGIPRFYQGVQFAVFQTPLSRFGDTAANTGVLELFAMVPWGVHLPLSIKTAVASAAGALWRILITPLDTLKTTLQVEGKQGYAQLQRKMACEGATVLYQGALANALASFVGSYPWFFAFNLAMRWLPAAAPGVLVQKLVRSAVAGIVASFVSDVVSNFLRVLKTTRQTAPTTIGYRAAAKQIIEKDGLLGLFARGLGTRVLTNALQASLFTVVWKYFEAVA
jgi:hypothetical protein